MRVLLASLLLTASAHAATFNFSSATYTGEMWRYYVTITVVRDQTSDAASVSYATSGSASRYPAASGTLSFAAGESTKTFTVGLYADPRLSDRSAYSFLVTLSNPTNNYTLGNIAQATVSVAEPAIVTVPQRVTLTEGVTTPITLTRSGDMNATVSFHLDYLGDLDEPAYTPLRQDVTFAPGEATKTIQMSGTNDSVYTGNRKQFIYIVLITGGLLFDGHQVFGGSVPYGPDLGLDIIDDEPPPTVSASDIVIEEGDSGTKVATFTINVSPPWEGYLIGTASPKVHTRIDVQYTTVAGTALAGSDFIPAAGTVIFADGAATSTVTVPIVGDTIPEIDKTFTLALTTNSTVAHIGHSAVCTIHDNDYLSSPGDLQPSRLSIERGKNGALSMILPRPASGSDVINIDNSAPNIANVPASITPLSGTTQLTVPISGRARGTSLVTVTLPASMGSIKRASLITVYDPATLTPSPSAVSLAAGGHAEITVTMEPPPESPVIVQASTDTPGIIATPINVEIPVSGTATFSIDALSNGSAMLIVTLPAVYGGSMSVVRVVVSGGTALTSITPNAGVASGGSLVKISGVAFDSSCIASFSNVAAADSHFTDSATLIVTTPPHAEGAVDVIVTCGSAISTLPGGFTFFRPPRSRGTRH